MAASKSSAVSKIAETVGVKADAQPTPSPSPTEATVASEQKDESADPIDARGTAMEAFLIDALQKSWEGTPDADKAAARAVTTLKLNAAKLPQETLSSLSGTPIKNGAIKGSLRVSIEGEADRREHPGFSNEDMQALQTFLDGTGNSAVAEIYKTDWRLENGAFSKEARSQKTSKEQVLLSDYKDGAFLCRKTKNRTSFIYGRLQDDDLRRGGAAFALASVDWQDDTPNTIALPPDFHYDKTLVIPGQFAFLSLPFQRQGRGGICAAASALNIVQYIAPEIEIEQRGVFALYNGGRSGASLPQIAGGLESLGFECELIQTHGCERKMLLSKIRASLDAGRPILAVIPGHALTIIGYNKPDGKLIVWDQRMNGPGVPAYLPKGGVEDSENCIQSKFEFVFLIRKVDTRLSVDEEKMVQSIFGTTQGCLRHEIVNANAGRESLPMFLRHAAPPKMQSVLQQSRVLLIPKSKRELVSITSAEDGKYQSKTLPGGKEDLLGEATLVRLLTESKGVFYSVPLPSARLEKSEVDTGNTATTASQPAGEPTLAEKGLSAWESIKAAAAAVSKTSAVSKIAETVGIQTEGEVKPLAATIGADGLPEGFHYEKSVIVPGQFVFLALPYEKQLLKGVCAAGSVLNVLQYVDPTIDLTQDEMFGLYNNQIEGATPPQMVGGMNNLGFSADLIPTRGAPASAVIAEVQKSLAANRPLIAGGENHAVTLVGFNKTAKTIIVWDQRAYGGNHASGMPAGMYEVKEDEFCNKYTAIIVIRKADTRPSKEKEAFLRAVTGRNGDLVRHTLVNSDSRKETMEKFAGHAVPTLMKFAMRRGETVLIPLGDRELISIAPQTSDTFSYTVLPGGKQEKCRMDFVTKAVLDAGGTFYGALTLSPH